MLMLGVGSGWGCEEEGGGWKEGRGWEGNSKTRAPCTSSPSNHPNRHVLVLMPMQALQTSKRGDKQGKVAGTQGTCICLHMYQTQGAKQPTK